MRAFDRLQNHVYVNYLIFVLHRYFHGMKFYHVLKQYLYLYVFLYE